MEIKLGGKPKEVTRTIKVPAELNRKPGESGCDYLRRAAMYMEHLPEFKERLR